MEIDACWFADPSVDPLSADALTSSCSLDELCAQINASNGVTEERRFPTRGTGESTAATVIDARKKGRKRKKKVLVEPQDEDEESSNLPADLTARLRLQAQQKSAASIIFDMHKFNMEQAEGLDKTDAKIAMAVKLGAKAPKKTSLNYKSLKERRSSQKTADLKAKSEFRVQKTIDKTRLNRKGSSRRKEKGGGGGGQGSHTVKRHSGIVKVKRRHVIKS